MGKDMEVSACRRGAMRVLALSKAYHPGLKPALLAGGFLEIKADGTPFTKEYFLKVKKEIRPVASRIADSIDLFFWKPVMIVKARSARSPSRFLTSSFFFLLRVILQRRWTLS